MCGAEARNHLRRNGPLRLGGLGGKGKRFFGGSPMAPSVSPFVAGRRWTRRRQGGGTVGVSDHARAMLCSAVSMACTSCCAAAGSTAASLSASSLPSAKQLQRAARRFYQWFCALPIGGLYTVSAFVNRRNPHVAQVLRHATLRPNPHRRKSGRQGWSGRRRCRSARL